MEFGKSVSADALCPETERRITLLTADSAYTFTSRFRTVENIYIFFFPPSSLNFANFSFFFILFLNLFG